MANITCIWCVAWRAVRTVIQTQDNRTGHHSERKAEEELGLPLEVAPASLGEVTGVGDLAA